METWHLACFAPELCVDLTDFPTVVGRGPTEGSLKIALADLTVSRNHFRLESRTGGRICLVNLNQNNTTEVDGAVIQGEVLLDAHETHLIVVGQSRLALGTDRDQVRERAQTATAVRYKGQMNGQAFGPFNIDQLRTYLAAGLLREDAVVWEVSTPEALSSLASLLNTVTSSVRAPEVPSSSPTSIPTAAVRWESADEGGAVTQGENIVCPYCRALVDLGSLLYVSVSQSLLGDSVLGPAEQARFLPAQFNRNGLALDSDGGVCTEIACPRCHMALPRGLLDTPQILMSVIGAPGAGKSVFLASAIWQCQQKFARNFGLSFMGLDPVANRWIDAYVQKLFFQEDNTSYQQIEKTEVNAATVCRSVRLDGDEVLLPLPSFFKVHQRQDRQNYSLVVYDSAGEHFAAGADTHASAVTLNMLNADVLFFMFDPSADPRLSSLMEIEEGAAHNRAQRQDIVLTEMAARISRHLGNRNGGRLDRPLIFGVSKADLLRDRLPLDAELYREIAPQQKALDFEVLRKVSAATENLLLDVGAVEVVDIAHEIASEVWFLPISSLGHNPRRNGVRPCDIKPIWTELPIVFTLARRGLIPSVGR